MPQFRSEIIAQILEEAHVPAKLDTLITMYKFAKSAIFPAKHA